MINVFEESLIQSILEWNPMLKLREFEISSGAKLTIHTVNLIIQVGTQSR